MHTHESWHELTVGPRGAITLPLVVPTPEDFVPDDLATWPHTEGQLEVPAEGGVAREVLPQCEGSLADATIPAGAPACWSPRISDTMSAPCRDAGWNLEFDVRWAGPIPTDAALWPSCELSRDEQVDCPALP